MIDPRTHGKPVESAARVLRTRSAVGRYFLEDPETGWHELTETAYAAAVAFTELSDGDLTVRGDAG